MIDLRSDTVTRPTEAMRTAMARADVGDDVYGEDPTVRHLEERVAAIFGHEAALFTVSGSMANLLALRFLVPVGTEVLCDSQAHIARAESGAHAALAGVTMRTWSGPTSTGPTSTGPTSTGPTSTGPTSTGPTSTGGGLVGIDVPQLQRMIAPDLGPFLVHTAAVSVENTHNFGGGAVLPLEQLREVRQLADRRGLGVHLDGARIWNAHVATGVPLPEYGGIADAMAVCLSKGLGAPVGSLMIGSADAVAEARVWRKRLGGGWRQAGVLAAAGLFALDHHIERLAEDHQHARQLADAAGIDPDVVASNMVLLDVGDAADVVDRLRAEGVLAGAVGPSTVRLVTHLDIDDDATSQACDVLAKVLAD